MSEFLIFLWNRDFFNTIMSMEKLVFTSLQLELVIRNILCVTQRDMLWCLFLILESCNTMMQFHAHPLYLA